MNRRFGWIFFSALVGPTACGGDDPGQGGPCLVTLDCPADQICSLGECVPGIDAGSPPTISPPPEDAGSRLDAGPPPGGEDGGPASCDRPATCEDLEAACGLVHDGCAFIECGDCADPETCGGGGVPNQCGAGVCTPTTTCASAGAECGYLDDGCSNMLDCGGCTDPETCGGGGVPNRCGGGVPMCVRSTCQALGVECGSVGDGCGGGLNCGSCPAFYACNAGKCSCDADTCDSLKAECGSGIPDGCGGTLDCGTCTAPEKCGGAGKARQCGCTKRARSTGWKNGTRAVSTSSWRNGSSAFALDNRYASFSVRQDGCVDNDGKGPNYVNPVTRTSNHLDIRGFDIKVPAGAELTGIEVRVKQSGGRIVEATVYTPVGGSSNQGQGRVSGGLHYYGGPDDLLGLALNAGHTNSPTPWGLSMRVRVSAPGGTCPGANGTTSSLVDVIQLRAHYEICN